MLKGSEDGRKVLSSAIGEGRCGGGGAGWDGAMQGRLTWNESLKGEAAGVMRVGMGGWRMGQCRADLLHEMSR